VASILVLQEHMENISYSSNPTPSIYSILCWANGNFANIFANELFVTLINEVVVISTT